MDYKEKYDKLVEAVKILQETNPSDEGIQNWVNDNVPELQESEDEKVRKALFDGFKRYDYLASFNGCFVKDILPWLEKLKVFTENGDGLYYFANSGFTYVGNPTWDNVSFLENQGQKKSIDELTQQEAMDIAVAKCFEQGEQKPANKVEPKFKVKYAGSEYNVLEVKDTAGVTFYGIEDELNHIDYVKAENCEIIGGYAMKENGSPYPTKPAVFSEQNHAWSEADDEEFDIATNALKDAGQYDSADWLITIKQRYTWKPSEEQMRALHDMNLTGNISYAGQGQALIELYNDLKKL